MRSSTPTLRDSIISRVHCEDHSGVQRTYLGINRRFFGKVCASRLGTFVRNVLYVIKINELPN